MRQSKLFTKTLKQAPKEELSLNAQLLIKAGYVDKLMSGAYTYLPLGLRVLEKIKDIVRTEMNNLGGQEILMPALLPKEPWQKTGRWDEPGEEVMFQFQGRSGKDLGLGWTHEEIVTPLMKQFVQSYKDLPVAVYQIQDKFRNEPRAKSGLLRGLEFSMKDLYSFHANEDDLLEYYEKSKTAYLNIFKHCGLEARIVEASGGDFSKFSHEFQVFTEYGEDTVFYCSKCDFAQNDEICELKAGDKCPECEGGIKEAKAIEVGNIFPLKTKYSKDFDFTFTDKEGKQKPVIMGCYGIGPSRVLGSVVEVHHDDKGIIWPEKIAPFQVHLLKIGDSDEVDKASENLYQELKEREIEVLFDDREESAGVKFNDSDLMGLPVRLVVSQKTLKKQVVEYKFRKEENSEELSQEELFSKLK
ncbi:MAG TPA: aminoacyl--tRNA ligase-related protein [Patescibacteria group bacterium]|nr:aminoacyl--tRNA ligase-related protein [Patescibacteria group bacterium]